MNKKIIIKKHINNNFNFSEKQVQKNSPIVSSDPKEPLCLTKLKIPKLEEFGPEFDVFDYSEKFGREKLLISVSHPIFHYKNINKYINFFKFPEFIHQIRLGYTSSPDSFYHTVMIIY